jgi:beta-galactosidase
MPADPPVAAYGRVELTQRATLLSALPQLSRSREPILAVCPLPSELFGLNRGFISYSTKIPRALLASAGGALFEVGNNATVHDIGTVLIDGVAQGTLDRGKGLGEGGSKLRLKEELALANDRNNNSTSAAFAELSVIVGMTGRSNQGTFFDTKGLNGSVLIDGEEIEGEWEVWPLPLDDAEKVTKLDLASLSSSSSSLLTVEESGPLLLRGTFEVSAEQAEASSVGEWEGEEGEEEVGEEDGKVGRRRRRRHPADTYFAFDGLSRGVVFVNGVALGWYDLVEGPQMRVFVPGVWLKRGTNDVLVLEMLSASSDGGVSAVESVLEPDFFGPPKKKNDGGQEEKQKEKKKSAASVEGAAAAAAAASEVETSTSSLLRFPGAGSLRTIEAASATT